MQKKFIIPSVCMGVAVCSVAVLLLLPNHHKHMPKIQSNMQNNEFVVDGGPMMPPPHFGPHPDMMHGKMFGPHPDMDKMMNLSENQRKKMKRLDEDFHKEIRSLHTEEEDLRDTYFEKMDSILTAEQFRQIQKMRSDLRKEMRKLQNKQEEILEKHRKDFELILTPEQRMRLERNHEQNIHEPYDVRSDRKAKTENNHKPVSPKHSKHK